MSTITFSNIKKNEEINTYIQKADDSMMAMHFTEHSFAHVTKTAMQAGEILERLGYCEREAELARIAGYMHDIGNVINRVDHAQSGAIMAFSVLRRLGMPAEDIATIINAIGNHDESTAVPVSAVSAAVILADKCDVRRSRVRNKNSPATFDIHDRVNNSVVASEWVMDLEKSTMKLVLTIDTELCAVMDYFEIFMDRMLLCRRAADFLGLRFGLIVNEAVLL